MTVTVKEEFGEASRTPQSRIPDDETTAFTSNAVTAGRFISKSKIQVEGGIDLRNKNVDIKNVVNS